MDVVSASHYDGAAATAEAALMTCRQTKRTRVLVSRGVHPHYRETMATYLSGGDLELDDPERFTESTPYNPSSPYSATKAGINNFVASVRLELRDTPVRTTVVAPGPVDTQMWDTLEGADQFERVLRRLNRLQMIPKKSPDLIARRTVAAVAKGRRHVRTPRRVSVAFWLGEAPRRVTELLLAKVPMDPD